MKTRNENVHFERQFEDRPDFFHKQLNITKSIFQLSWNNVLHFISDQLDPVSRSLLICA